MAVLSIRELTGRDFTHRFGEAPIVTRRFGVTLDNPATANQLILNAINIPHGDPHPEYPFLLCIEGSVKEATPTPYHAEVTYRYELPQVGTAEWEPNPIARPPQWNFSPTTTSVPAMNYYHGDDNDDQRPLVSSRLSRARRERRSRGISHRSRSISPWRPPTRSTTRNTLEACSTRGSARVSVRINAARW
jgi:hypothetical protein